MKLGNRGFTSIILISVLPVFLATLTFSLALFKRIQVSERAERACLELLLTSDRWIRRPLTELTRLNSQATRLQSKRKRAQKLLRIALASGEPTVVASAKAYLAYVVGRQFLLASKQKSLISQIHLLSTQHQSKVPQRFKEKTNSSLGVARTNHFKPNLIATPPFSMTPVYNLVQGFGRQKSIDWSINGWNGSPSMIHSLRKMTPKLLEIKGSCSSKMIRKGNRWKIEIVEAKSS